MSDCSDDKCLRDAARDGSLSKVKQFLRGAKDIEGAACLAAKNGHDEILVYLIQQYGLKNFTQLFVCYLKSGKTQLLDKFISELDLNNNANTLGRKALLDMTDVLISTCNLGILIKLLDVADIKDYGESFYNSELGFDLNNSDAYNMIKFLEERDQLDIQKIFIHSTYKSNARNLNQLVLDGSIEPINILYSLKFAILGKNESVIDWLWNYQIDKHLLNGQIIEDIVISSTKVNNKYFIHHLVPLYYKLASNSCAIVYAAALVGNLEYLKNYNNTNNTNNRCIDYDLVKNGAESGSISTLEYVKSLYKGNDVQVAILEGSLLGSNISTASSTINSLFDLGADGASEFLTKLLYECAVKNNYASVRLILKFINNSLANHKDNIINKAITSSKDDVYSEMRNYITSL